MSEITQPADWPSRRLKYVATYNDGVLPEDTDEDQEIDYVEISGVSLSRGIEEIERITFGQAPSRARRKVQSGDVLVSTVRTYLRAIAKVDSASPNLIASTGFCVVRPGNEVDSSFIGWVAKSEPFVSEVVARSVGVSYPAINASELVNIRVPLPPLETQCRIANFLDEKTAKIDALIETKRALLDRLAEKRQALITRAVTKGLNPEVPMKPSGIDWLGDIPVHWDVLPLRHVGEVILGLTYSPEDVCEKNEGVLVVRASNVQDGRLVHADDVWVSTKIPEKLLNRVGDLIVCSRNGSRHLIGKSAIVTEEWAGNTFGAFMTSIRSKYPEWLRWILSSSLFEFQSGRYMSTTINQLTASTLKSFPVPIPPTEIQHEISRYLDEQCGAVDSVSKNIGASIEKLGEYRAALITAAVTGQLPELNG